MRLADLTDVNVSNPQDGEVLTYDSATEKWTNQEAVSGYTGPLDAVPGAAFAFDQFAPSAAYLAGVNNYALLRRDSDNESLQFQYLANGSPPTANIVAWRDAEGAAIATVETWNNGDGNSAEFVSVAPRWVVGSNSIPAIENRDTGGSSRLVATDVPMSAGARSFVFVLDYTENEDGNYVADITQSDDNTLIQFGTYFANPDEFWVATRSIDGVSFNGYRSTATLTTGVHVVEVNYDASGEVTILFDGVDAGATIEEGAAFPLEAYATNKVVMPHGAPVGTAYTRIQAFYGWNTNSTAAAVAMLSDRYL